VLDRASATINPGENVGLVGRNGAGKSSLFALLHGHLHEDSGDFQWPRQWRLAQVAQDMPETDQPATAFVAGFVGESNRLPGRVAEAAAGGDALIDTALGRFRARNPHGLVTGEAALLFVRPEAMRIAGGENRLPARLVRRDLEGPFVNLFFAAGEETVAVHLTNRTGIAAAAETAQTVGFDAAEALLLPRPEPRDAAA
jgi:spermidine/putrescine transport system ATP-binding protein